MNGRKEIMSSCRESVLCVSVLILVTALLCAGCGSVFSHVAGKLGRGDSAVPSHAMASCPPVIESFDWPMWGERMQNYRAGRKFPRIDTLLRTKWEVEGLHTVHSTPAQARIRRDWDAHPGQYRAMDHLYVIDETSMLTAIDAHRTSPGGVVQPVWQTQLPHGTGVNYSSLAVSPVINAVGVGLIEEIDRYVWIYALDDVGGFHVFQDFGVTENLEPGVYVDPGDPNTFVESPLEVLPHTDPRYSQLLHSWDYAIGSPTLLKYSEVGDDEYTGEIWVYFGGHKAGVNDELYAVRIWDDDPSVHSDYLIEVQQVELGGSILSTPVIGEQYVYVLVSTVETPEPNADYPCAVVKAYSLAADGSPPVFELTSPPFHWYLPPEVDGCETLASPVFLHGIDTVPASGWLYVSGPSAVHVFDPSTLQYADLGDGTYLPYMLPADGNHRITSQPIAAAHALLQGGGISASNVVYIIENGVDYWRIKAYCDWPDEFVPGVTPPAWQSVDIPGQCYSHPYIHPGDPEDPIDLRAVWVSSTSGLYAFEAVHGDGTWNPPYDPEEPHYGARQLKDAYDADCVLSSTSHRDPSVGQIYDDLRDVYVPISDGSGGGCVRCLTPDGLGLYSISGRVSYDPEQFQGIPDVAIICEYVDGPVTREPSAFTNENGDYLITGMPSGVNVTIRPYKTGMIFTPSFVGPLLVQGNINQDFVADQ